MSDATKQAVEDAVRAHMVDECEGAFLVDYLVFAAGVVPEHSDRTRYFGEFSDSPMHTHLGLAEMLKIHLHEQTADDDDE